MADDDDNDGGHGRSSRTCPSPPESVLPVLTEFGQAEAAAILDAPDTRPDAARIGTVRGLLRIVFLVRGMQRDVQVDDSGRPLGQFAQARRVGEVRQHPAQDLVNGWP